MSRYSIVGSNGFVGSALVRFLRKSGSEVLEWPKGTRPEARQAVGHVIYAAGVTGDFRERPFDVVRAHIADLEHWLALSSFESFLYLSSTRVYRVGRTTQEDRPVLADSRDPGAIYDISKLMGECLTLASGRDVETRVARLSNLVGPNMPVTGGGSVVQLIEAARGGRVTMASSPETSKDFVHISDAVRALAWLGPNGSRPIYNVASGKLVSLQQWLDWLSCTFTFTVQTIPGAQDDSEPSVDVELLSAEFGDLASSIWSDVSTQ